MNGTMIYLTIAFFSIKVKNCNPLNASENNERYEIKPRTMFEQTSERNIWLVGGRKDLGIHGILPPNQLARYFFQISALTCSWLSIMEQVYV